MPRVLQRFEHLRIGRSVATIEILVGCTIAGRRPAVRLPRLGYLARGLPRVSMYPPVELGLPFLGYLLGGISAATLMAAAVCAAAAPWKPLIAPRVACWLAPACFVLPLLSAGLFFAAAILRILATDAPLVSPRPIAAIVFGFVNVCLIVILEAAIWEGFDCINGNVRQFVIVGLVALLVMHFVTALVLVESAYR